MQHWFFYGLNEIFTKFQYYINTKTYKIFNNLGMFNNLIQNNETIL